MQVYLWIGVLPDMDCLLNWFSLCRFYQSISGRPESKDQHLTGVWTFALNFCQSTTPYWELRIKTLPLEILPEHWISAPHNIYLLMKRPDDLDNNLRYNFLGECSWVFKLLIMKACLLLLCILSVINSDWLLHSRSIRRVYEFIIIGVSAAKWKNT